MYFIEYSTEDVSKDEKSPEEEKKAEPTPMVSYSDLVRKRFMKECYGFLVTFKVSNTLMRIALNRRPLLLSSLHDKENLIRHPTRAFVFTSHV